MDDPWEYYAEGKIHSKSICALNMKDNKYFNCGSLSLSLPHPTFLHIVSFGGKVLNSFMYDGTYIFFFTFGAFIHKVSYK